VFQPWSPSSKICDLSLLESVHINVELLVDTFTVLEADEVRAADALAEHHVPGSGGSGCLEHMLREIQPDGGNLRNERLFP